MTAGDPKIEERCFLADPIAGNRREGASQSQASSSAIARGEEAEADAPYHSTKDASDRHESKKYQLPGVTFKGTCLKNLRPNQPSTNPGCRAGDRSKDKPNQSP